MCVWGVCWEREVSVRLGSVFMCGLVKEIECCKSLDLCRDSPLEWQTHSPCDSIVALALSGHSALLFAGPCL